MGKPKLETNENNKNPENQPTIVYSSSAPPTEQKVNPIYNPQIYPTVPDYQRATEQQTDPDYNPQIYPTVSDHQKIHETLV